MQLVNTWAPLRPAGAHPASGKPRRRCFASRTVTWASGAARDDEAGPQQFGLPSLPSIMGPGGQQQVTPSRLVSGASVESSTVDPRPLTVYTLRLCTGWRSGSAQLDPNAGVHLALVAQDGSTLLHRVGPINDPAEREAELKQMCEVIVTQPDVGANCPVALDSARKRNAGRQCG